MDIRRYRLFRQQQRENGQGPSPNASPPEPVPSVPRSATESPNSSHFPRRPSRLSKFMMGRKNKQNGDNHEEEVELKTLMPSDQTHGTDDNVDEPDDYSPNFSRAAAHPAKNGPSGLSYLSLNALKSIVRIIIRSPFALPSSVFLLISILLVIIFVNRVPLYIMGLRLMHVPPGVYSRDGKLFIGKDTRFFIKGVSWYGMEEEEHVLRGLDKVSIEQVLDFCKQHEFNAIRLPLSMENLKANPISHKGVSTFLNPAIPNIPYKDVIRVFVRKAAEKNILVLLDMHRLFNVDVKSSGYWFKEKYTFSTLVQMWEELATTFADEWNILGADLYNEPWNATWNDNPQDPENWKHAAETLSNKIHQICPSWLLFIEGVGNRALKCEGCFWAENLNVVQDSPPVVDRKEKIVLSPHVYGPAVFTQKYMKPKNFLDKMPEIWDQHFGKCANLTGIATVIGEWGGTFEEANQDADWQRKFYKYLSDKEFSFFYWCLNPESEDTGGLLKADWKTPEPGKLSLIAGARSTNVEDHKEHFKWFRDN